MNENLNNGGRMTWETTAEEKFQALIARVPVFLREMARDKISRKAEDLARQNGRAEVTEKEMVDAFFAETPFGFHGPMKYDMEEIGLDYTRYGHDK